MRSEREKILTHLENIDGLVKSLQLSIMAEQRDHDRRREQIESLLEENAALRAVSLPEKIRRKIELADAIIERVWGRRSESAFNRRIQEMVSEYRGLS